MAVKIKLMRLGKIREPYYRIVVADARTRRNGKAIEAIGKYHPKQEPSYIEVNSERVQYWLSVGAQPTEPVQRLLELTGDWQKFKGLPVPEGALKKPEPKPDKKALFEAALAAANEEPSVEAVTPKKKGGKKADKAEKAEKTEAGAEAEKAEGGEA
ncbi:MAG TPA: 30S ribosomal protein S16 [Pseudonocardiaceae bacterium]